MSHPKHPPIPDAAKMTDCGRRGGGARGGDGAPVRGCDMIVAGVVVVVVVAIVWEGTVDDDGDVCRLTWLRCTGVLVADCSFGRRIGTTALCRRTSLCPDRPRWRWNLDGHVLMRERLRWQPSGFSSERWERETGCYRCVERHKRRRDGLNANYRNDEDGASRDVIVTCISHIFTRHLFCSFRRRRHTLAHQHSFIVRGAAKTVDWRDR